MEDNWYQPETIRAEDLQDGDIFELEGVRYRVGVRNPDDDFVEIQTNQEIQENGISEWKMTIATTRVDNGQLGSHQFTKQPPVRNSEGELEDGGPFVEVWRPSVRQPTVRRSRVSWPISALVIVASLLAPAIYSNLIPPLGFINGRQDPVRDLPPYWDQAVSWSDGTMAVLTGLVAAAIIVLVLTRRLRAAGMGVLVQVSMMIASTVTILAVGSGLTL